MPASHLVNALVRPEWRAEQDRLLRDVEAHQGADQTYIEEGVQNIANHLTYWRLRARLVERMR